MSDLTDAPRSPHPLRTNWRQPVVTTLSMSIAVALVAVPFPMPGPLVLAGVLAMTLSRNRLVQTWRGRAEAVILLPIVALATAGVDYLFVALPIVGAIAYVVAMFLSIYLRRFGPTWLRIGSLIALPFITLLIAPGAGVGTTPLGVALLSVVVLVIVVGVRLIAEATGLLPTARPMLPGSRFSARPTVPPATPPNRGLRPVASTRMAIQMAIALAAAFGIGWLLIPQHVMWVVLTAFIVCSGNRGRADVLYKSGLRIAGAAIGTVAATLGLMALTPAHPLLQGPPLVIALLVILGVGLWLREWTYAAWAVVMTLVITLLQGSAIHVAAGTGGQHLWLRILAIIVGALCGLAASWFVLPVRSENVVRRRVADSLAALSDYAAEPGALTDERLTLALQKLDEVAAPWRALERATRWRTTDRKPGQWMALIHESAHLVRLWPALSVDARRALGNARRTMRDPQSIGPALLALRDELRLGN